MTEENVKEEHVKQLAHELYGISDAGEPTHTPARESSARLQGSATSNGSAASAHVEIPSSAHGTPRRSQSKTFVTEMQQKRPLHIFSGGATYVGDWLGDKRHGHGVQVWPDGARFEGQFVANLAEGEGRFVHVDGDVYEGQWRGDRAHGDGTYTHAEGSKYVGQWEYDKQHGNGVEKWPDGAQYSGGYERGHKHGYGEFTWVDGSQYKGEFIDNNIHGVGAYHWHDGRCYTGQWLNNRMHGHGVFHWQDGRSYSGQYVNDQKEGIGIFSWPDGRAWQGRWAAGKQEGIGIYTTAKGVRKGGVWNSGRREQWLDELPEISSGQDVVLTLHIVDSETETNNDNLSLEGAASSQGSMISLSCTRMSGEVAASFAVDAEKETLMGLRKMIGTKLAVHWVSIKLVFADQGLLQASSDKEVLASVFNLPRCAGCTQTAPTESEPDDVVAPTAPTLATFQQAVMAKSTSRSSKSRSCCIS